MANRNYINGRHTEYMYRDFLLSDDYDVCLRTAGSHSPIDLIAIGKKGICMVQMKKTAQKPSIRTYAQEIQDLADVEVPTHCTHWEKRFVVHCTKKGFKGFHIMWQKSGNGDEVLVKNL